MNYLLLYIFLLLHLNANCQSGFKKNINHQDTVPTVLLAVVSTQDNEIIVLGGTIDNFGTAENAQGIYLLKIDTSGFIISDTIISEFNKTYFIPRFPSFIKTKNNNYVFKCIKTGVNRFFKIDKDLKVIINKEIPTITQNANKFKVSSIIETSNGFLITESKAINNEPQIQLVNLENNGDLISDKIINRDDKANQGILTQTNNKNYLTSIQREKVQDSVRNHTFYIDEIDEDGNLMNIDSFNQTYEYNGISAIRSMIDDGSGLIVNRAYEEYYDDGPTTDIWQRPFIQKLDYSFDKVIWEIPYGHQDDGRSPTNGFFSINETHDGNIISAGNYSISDLGTAFIIHMKYSPEGDIIWVRQDTIESNIDYVTHNLRSSIVLPSGSIVSVGDYKAPYVGGLQKGFIMKIDKHGCIEEDCSGRLLFTHTKDTELVEEVSIYPNPVRETCNLSTDLADYDLELYNSFGGIIKRYSNISSDYSLQTDDLISGIYYIRVSKGTRFMILKMVKM